MLIDAILLTTIGLFGLWAINKHYDNVYEIEELQKAIKLTRCKVCKGAKVILYNFTGNAKYKDDDEYLNPEVREEPCPQCQQYDMKKMQRDLIEFRQSLINIDAKYKRSTQGIQDSLKKVENHSLELHYLKDNINTFRSVDVEYSKDGISFDPMENRTKAEKEAFDRLAKQIAGGI